MYRWKINSCSTLVAFDEGGVGHSNRRQITSMLESIDRHPVEATPLIVAVLAMLFPAMMYVGSYFALVRPLRYASLKRVGPHQVSSNKTADYRIGGDAAEVVFFPVNWLDRKIRYETWQ